MSEITKAKLQIWKLQFDLERAVVDGSANSQEIKDLKIAIMNATKILVHLTSAKLLVAENAAVFNENLSVAEEKSEYTEAIDALFSAAERVNSHV